MGLFLQDKTNDTQWAVWKVEESLEALLALLPDARRVCCEQELLQFASERRKIEWLSVRVLLYFMLKEDKQIGYSSEGKPFLTDDSFFISISHTKGYVAVVLGLPGREVGVDIEQYGERVRKVAHKFMREDEQPSVFRGTDTWSLLLHWLAKETMFKCLNASEVDFRGHMRILPFAVNESGVFSAEEYRTVEKRRFTIHYYLFPDFVLTLSL